MSDFKKNNPGISRGLSVKKFGFLTFSRKRYYEFFDNLHDDRAQYSATFEPGVRFQKKQTGISWGLSVKKFGFLTFFRNATMIF